MSRTLPLSSVDEDCSKVLQREMKKREIKFIVNKVVESYKDKDDKISVTIGPIKVMLAHVASEERLVAAENAMGGCKEMDNTTSEVMQEASFKALKKSLHGFFVLQVD